MWIPKKKWDALEKRVADLEKKVQSQPEEITEALTQNINLVIDSTSHTLQE